MWAENNINLGDYFSKYFIDKYISDKKQFLYDLIGITGFFYIDNRCLNSKLKFIWGRGFMGHDKAVQNIDANRFVVNALRGKLSVQKFKNYVKDYRWPIAIGDPGILASTIYPISNTTKKYKIGFIPHWFDRRMYYKTVLEKYNDVFHFINIDGNSDIEGFWKEINQCEIIFTSSLHGSVFAHSYGIPSYYVCMDKHNVFTRFRQYKFEDYYTNYNELTLPKYNFFRDIEPLIKNSELYKVFSNIDHSKYTPSAYDVEQMKNRLIDAFPFKELLAL